MNIKPTAPKVSDLIRNGIGRPGVKHLIIFNSRWSDISNTQQRFGVSTQKVPGQKPK